MIDYNELFKYRDGKLFNRFTRNPRAKKGQRAGSGGGWRYRRIVVDGKKVYEHRIIWEMHNGPIPHGMVIDHMNCDHSDNRIENLRCVTQSDNLKNSRRYAEARGTQQLRSGNYRATIQVEAETIYIGTFKTEEEAHNAYLEARLHGI